MAGAGWAMVVAASLTGMPSPSVRDAASEAPPGQATFDTTLTPRVETTFLDARGLRAILDRFAELDREMQKVRDDFSTSVQRTLATLPGVLPARGAPACPEKARTSYARAAVAGARFLELGRSLEALYRQIRRADEEGETQALTPDYRNQAKLTRDAYRTLSRDFREMHVAFYEQLGAELRHVGCDKGALASVREAASAGPDPGDASSWDLEGEEAAPAPSVAPPPAKTGSREPEPPPSATSVWILVDNTGCASDARVVLDGSPPLTVAGGKQLSLRTTTGPHDLCALPVSDPRGCGAADTVRRAYLHEGWTLTLHCPR